MLALLFLCESILHSPLIALVPFQNVSQTTASVRLRNLMLEMRIHFYLILLNVFTFKANEKEGNELYLSQMMGTHYLWITLGSNE